MPLHENDWITVRAAAVAGAHDSGLPPSPRITRFTPLAVIVGISIVAAVALVLFCQTPALILMITLAMATLTVVAWYLAHQAQQAATLRTHAELNDRFLFRLDERLRQMSGADAIIDEAIRNVGEYLNITYCRFGERNIQEATDR